MIRVSHTDTLGEIGVRSVRVEYRGITLSIVGYTNHEQLGDPDRFWTQMEQMRLFRGDEDITELAPACNGGELTISHFDEILSVIKLIDNGHFDKKEVRTIC